MLCSLGLVVGLLTVATAAWAGWEAPVETDVAEPAAKAQAAQPTGSGGRTHKAGVASEGSRVGHPAPQIGLQLLDGSVFALSEMAGRVLVLNFWSPSCGPCKEELPDLQAVWENYQDEKVTVVGVSLPGQEEALEEIMTEYGITYPMSVNNLAPRMFGVTGVPETVIVGPDGNVAYAHSGKVTADVLREELDVLLKQ
jgi:peroxiredoxin